MSLFRTQCSCYAVVDVFDDIQNENTALHFAAMTGLQRCVEVRFLCLVSYVFSWYVDAIKK